jgi:hypothetical protein
MPHDLREVKVFYSDAWLTTAKPQGLLTPEGRDRALERRRADATELAHRQQRASRKARLCLAPITEPATEVEGVTVIAPRRCGRGRSPAPRQSAAPPGRTDLLDLDADPGGVPAAPPNPAT